MSFWHKLLGRKSADAGGLPDILDRILGGWIRSKSGANVNLDTALQVGAVFACVRVLAEGVAQVPFKLMQESKSAVSVYPQVLSATDHPLYDILHRQPNDWQTSFEFRETMIMHASLTGAAFVFKNLVKLGNRPATIAELILLDPGRVTVVQHPDWSRTYKVQGSSGEVKEFSQDFIWHFRGPSWNGIDGLNILKLARDAIGLSISTEETHSALHKNGVQISGVYSVEGTLDETQHKKMSKWLREEHAGADNASRLMLLDRAAKFTAQKMSGVDAEHLATRNHQVQEICRFFRVLPLMIGFSDKTQTFASAEQMFLAHVVHTLMPWYERLQQSTDINLLTRAERRQGFFAKLLEAGLLRGAMKDTAEYLYRLTLGGIMVRNEARNKLDLNPLPGLDEPLTPTNMTNDPSGAPAQTSGA